MKIGSSFAHKAIYWSWLAEFGYEWCLSTFCRDVAMLRLITTSDHYVWSLRLVTTSGHYVWSLRLVTTSGHYV
ncbi:hypothetical protein [Fischerella thermalis]|uniref:hypothetical protein n=1 Tax=Fischerella thermalis TaxID=372787 RepID=UPI0010392435|nr:hypothetical protein [Fischerella thermalis]